MPPAAPKFAMDQELAAPPPPDFTVQDLATLAATLAAGWSANRNPAVMLTQPSEVEMAAEAAVAFAVQIALEAKRVLTP